MAAAHRDKTNGTSVAFSSGHFDLISPMLMQLRDQAQDQAHHRRLVVNPEDEHTQIGVSLLQLSRDVGNS
jgi:hypothetical protein